VLTATEVGSLRQAPPGLKPIGATRPTCLPAGNQGSRQLDGMPSQTSRTEPRYGAAVRYGPIAE